MLTMVIGNIVANGAKLYISDNNATVTNSSDFENFATTMATNDNRQLWSSIAVANGDMMHQWMGSIGGIRLPH